MSPTSVREATWQDLAQMAELEQACFPDDAWTEGTFWSELAQRPHRTYLVARDEHAALVGYAGVSVAGDVADVMTVAVDPGQRGRGTGSLLLAELHRTARAQGGDSIMLEVREDNHAARHLYSGTGYQVVHRRPGYYRTAGDGPAVDALIMSKELTPDE